MKVCIGIYCLAVALWTVCAGAAAWAAAPHNDLEVLQADATLQYHTKDWKGAVETLKQLLERSAGNIAALELLALCQRRLGNEAEAAVTYRKLLTLTPDERKPAYSFELATILMKHKQFSESRALYATSADAGFNPGTSRFFIGVIDFTNKDWRSARTYLADSLAYEDAKPVTKAARLYLASADEQLGYADAAIRNYYKAALPDVDTLTGGVRQNALKALRQLNRGSSFAMLSLISQYDTNVQANPSDVPNPIPQSMERSMKEILNAAFGTVSTPVSSMQYISSLKLFSNYNLNRETRDYQFGSTTGSLIAMYKPYKEFSYGLKAEGTYTMKNTVDASTPTTGNVYKSYSLTGDIGPLARYELTPSTHLALEGTWRPKKFFQDAATGDTRRTGQGYFTRAGVEHIRSYYLNPNGYASFERDLPAGDAYQFYAIGAGLGNSMYLSDKLTFSPQLDATRTVYSLTSAPMRVDFLYSVRLAAQYALTTHWNLLADAGYLLNHSTVPATFQYNRTVASIGATYFF